MGTPVNALRVLIKAAFIFIVLNLLFAWWDPPVGRLTAYNWLWPGRVRFPYSQSPRYYSMDYNNPLIQDLDAMFGAHIISADSKPADEYRVLLLGDSATWGVNVTPQDTLASQINRLNLTTCNGRKIKAYNLGYPWPSLLRDVLILDYAQRYQPDMAVWLVTVKSFLKNPADSDFLGSHYERLAEVIEEHQLDLPRVYTERSVQITFWDRTIIGQKENFKNLILSQVYGLMWAATGIDNAISLPAKRPPISQNVEADVSYLDYRSAEESSALVRSFMFNILRVGQEISEDAPLIILNEPIFIVSGKNSDLRYNPYLPRWAYDAYRQALGEWIASRGYPFYDYWNVLTASEFSDNKGHRNLKGEQHLAELLAPILQEFSCP